MLALPSKLTAVLIICTIISALIFFLFPQLDLIVSGYFYTDNLGFIYRESFCTKFIYEMIYKLTVAISLWIIIALIIKRFKPAVKSLFLPANKFLIFLLLTLAIGPGLLVHQGFKDYFQRARPVNIEQFGGKKIYTPAFIKSNQGGKSFVSGHTAAGFYICAFAFLFMGRKKTYTYLAGTLFGVIVGFSRIAQGAHFLSDVVFAALVTLLTIQLLRRVILYTITEH